MTAPETRRIQLPDAPPAQAAILAAGGVACWSQPLEIDTYEPAEPDRYPLFLDRRVYQGSSGRVYPIPFVDRIASERRPRMWQAVHLENEWVRLVVLPEIGGRIHVAYDKTRDYDFFYRNNVVKPALVGLAGPWISGGVEFNWPQHHRPATFLPVDTTVERHEDGGATVWQADLDPLQRMRARHGIRLRPDSSAIEVEAVLTNRTDVPQTFLWWANVAVAIHDGYQSFFPPDVRWVADHARRAVTAFPRADRPYYGVDYPALAREREGTDRLDRPSRILVPSSYMVTDTAGSFFGGYDHRVGAGFVHWADHEASPGKKQWTWGSGPVGQAWDRLLTDADGPYAELMAGVYTDNQPDFSRLAAGETRRFSQYWYPVQDIGPAQEATREAAVAVTVGAGSVRVGVASAVVAPDARIALSDADGVVVEWITDLAPGSPFLAAAPLAAGAEGLRLVVEADGRELVSWRPAGADAAEPWVATEPPAPADIASAERLQLTGVHLEQYRHPTRAAAPYFEEVLRRDPGDSRANASLAELAFRRGEHERALGHLDAAVARLTERNLNPASGEAHYRRALVLERLGRVEEAFRDAGKAAWDDAWAAPAELVAARVALHAGHAAVALDHAQRSLRARPGEARAEAVRVLALHSLGRDAEAAAALAAARAEDPFDPLLAELAGGLDTVDPGTPLLVGFELARMGAWRAAADAARVSAEARPGPFGNPAPLARYARAHWLAAAGEPYRAPDPGDTRLFFPAGLDAHDLLRTALARDPHDPVARAALGCWLLDAGRIDDALAELRRAIEDGSDDPVAWRNAAVATVNSGGDLVEADRLFAGAIALAPGDARLCFERDQLDRLRGASSADRLARIAAFGPHALDRDDVAIEWAGLLVDTGRHAEALALLAAREFQPFEGGEGRVIAVWDRAQVAAARELLPEDPRAAARLLEDGIEVPAHLGEGRHPAVPMAERLVALGDALDAAGDPDGAARARRRAVAGGGALAVAPRRVDEADYWVGVALAALGETAEAERRWAALDARAAELEAGPDPVDYFATSLPELLLFSRESPGTRARLAARLRALAAAGRAGERRMVP